MSRLIIGCGYLGHRVGRQWLERGHEVHALTRSKNRAASLEAEGFRPIVGDVVAPASLDALPAVDVMLYAVGFDRSSGRDMRTIYVDGLRNVLDSLDGEPRIVYISTTGVYGQCDGSWVDEESPTEPTREGGRVCLEAEQTLSAHRLGARATILRLAGIYGPGRIPRLDALLAGEAIPADPDVWLNLIHVDDAARIVDLVIEQADVERLLLVADGQPMLRRDFYKQLAQLTESPSPSFSTTQPGRRGGTNRRISSRRMMDVLKPTLVYPHYQAGLAAILDASPESSE